MTDKLVTREDLPTLYGLKAAIGSPEAVLFDRLIAAAEADASPLPEGWYLFTDRDGTRSVWHLPARGSDLTQYDDGSGVVALSLTDVRDDLTPLRPTVTAADVEKAAEAGHESEYIAPWSHLHADTRACFVRQLRVALDTLGIEVQP